MAAASVFPLLALALQENVFVAALLAATVAWVVADCVRLLAPPLNRLFHRSFGALLRPREEERITGATYVLLGTLAAFLAFERDVAVVGVLFTAVGDPVAALAGSRFTRGRVWGKSPAGSVAMAAAAMAVFGALRLTRAVEVGWLAAAAGALAAAVVELLPLPLDDNLRIPLAAGGAIALLS